MTREQYVRSLVIDINRKVGSGRNGYAIMEGQRSRFYRMRTFRGTLQARRLSDGKWCVVHPDTINFE